MDSQRNASRSLLVIKRALIAAVIILGLHVCYVARDVIMPIVLGFLIALTLRPVARAAERRGIPAALVAVLLMPVLALAVGVGAYSLSGPVSDLIGSAPRIGQQLELKFAEFNNEIRAVKDASEQVEKIAKGGEEDGTQKVVVEQPALLATAASTLVSGLTSFAVAMVLATFLLSTGTLFYEKMIALTPLLSEKKRALRLVYDLEKRVSRYLFTITLINIGLGVVIGSALALYGFENAVLWGAIATLLNFLPFIGALVGIVCVGALAIVTYPTLGAALVVPAIYAACTTIEGNFVTPMIVGRRLELNIVAVFLTVVVWGWLWGIAGALMAVPILVVVKVLCDNTESLRPFGEFLSGRHVVEEDEPEEEQARTA